MGSLDGIVVGIRPGGNGGENERGDHWKAAQRQRKRRLFHESHKFRFA